MLNKRFPRLLPEPIRKNMRVAELIDGAFKAYNGGRLAEGCRLFTEKMLAGEGCVGMSLDRRAHAGRAGARGHRAADEGRVSWIGSSPRGRISTTICITGWAWSSTPARRF